MNRKAVVLLCVLLAAHLYSVRIGYSDPPFEGDNVDGVVGFTPVGNETYVAFFVSFGSEHALSGIRWYSSDGAVVFPKVLIAPGYEDGPGAITEAIVVGTNVACATLDWTDLEFEQPIASSHAGLHVILQLPVGSEFQEEGFGGGVGFGYQRGETGVSGWITADGEDWIGLKEGSRFAVQISLVAVEPGMVLMSPVRGRSGSDPGVPPELETAGVIAAPNPFNPNVQIWYNLPEPANIRVEVFDIRGARLCCLLDESRSAGPGQVIWTGADDTGRRVASGSYVIVVNRGRDVVRRTVMLLK
jgi:hypothetical protein